MKQIILCVLMLVFVGECSAEDSTTFMIKHASSGKFLHPLGGSSNPTTGTHVVVSSSVHERMHWTFEYVMDQWGYIKHKSSGKLIHPEGGSLNPSNGVYFLLSPSRHWGALFALDAVNDHIIHKGGKYLHPEGGSANPSDSTDTVVSPSVHDAMRWKFVSINDRNEDVLVYGIPVMVGEWKIINMVLNPIAEHTSTLEIMVGKSVSQSTTTNFQYTWEVSAGVEIKIFSASVSQSFSFMIEKTSSATWSEEVKRTRTIKVNPGQSVVTWQYNIQVEQNASKSIYQSDLLADTDSTAKVPETPTYSA